MVGAVVLVAVLVASVAVGLLLRAREGRMRPVAPPRTSTPTAVGGDPADLPQMPVDLLARLGAAPGSRATLLQFSSSFCQPCRATRVVLRDVAESLPGVQHVEVDAEHHLDVVRAYDIRRTPTVFVLDADGTIVVRASGQPRKADVVAALGRFL